MVEQVGDDGKRANPPTPDLGRGALQTAFDRCAETRVGVVDAVALAERPRGDRDVEAGLGQCMGTGTTDAPACTGHQRHPTAHSSGL
jgi:hypothetical protein